jgi:ketosteroid isomerase-like protein
VSAAETTASEVLAAAGQLVRAFGQHDTDAYFGCFAPGATFIFYSSPARLASREEYRQLWQQWESQDGFRVLACSSERPAVQDLGEVAVFTHEVTTTVRTRAGQQTLAERETIVFRRDRERWIAVHEHLSPQPPPGT